MRKFHEEKFHIEEIIADRGLDWFIANTQGIIKRYSSNRSIHNDNIIRRYSNLLMVLYDMKKQQQRELRKRQKENKKQLHNKKFGV